MPALPDANAPANFEAVITRFVAIAARMALGFLLKI
jgi:hypothetical protein